MTLDADKGDNRFAVEESIRIRQGDSLSYILDIDVRQGGQVVDLTGYAVRLYATKPDGSAVIDGENVEVAEAAAGRVRYTVPPQLVDTVGRVAPCYLRITEAGNQSEWSLSTASFELDVVRGVGANLASGEYIPEIDGLLADMDKQLSDFSQAEEARASGEEARETAEQNRAEAERLRSEAETARLSNESSRTSAEDSRAAAESSRVTAEQARASAEAERAAEFAVFEAKAQEWVPRILAEGEYDPMTRKPTLAAGEFCTVYMSPSADSADMNAYDEYMWVPDDSEAGGHFEKLGASSVDFPAATVADVAGILDGTVTQGGAGITVTAMAALKAGFDDAYAAAEHDHAIADVTGLRGELDDLDAAIGKLPVMADVNAKAGTGSGEEKVDSADVKGSPGEGGYLDVLAKKVDDALMLRAWDAGTVEMIRFDGDGYESDWSFDANELMSSHPGKEAADLSYAALRALPPGSYVVPSTAANQPTSGQGDGNLMVGRCGDNRVWAVVTYNTGAVYSAYGYEHQGSTANFGWRRIDNMDSDLVRTNRGMLTDLSWASLYSLAQTAPGTYLVSNKATGGPSAAPTGGSAPTAQYGNLFLALSGGNRIVAILAYDNGVIYGMYGSDSAKWTRLDNLDDVAASKIVGVLGVAHGGLGSTTVAQAITTLFGNSQNPASRLYVPVFGAGCAHNGFVTFAQLRGDMGISNSSSYALKVGSFIIQGGAVYMGDGLAAGRYVKTINFSPAFSALPVVLVSYNINTGDTSTAMNREFSFAQSQSSKTSCKINCYMGTAGETGFCWMAIGPA